MSVEDGKCECCGRREGSVLVDFRDHGPVFFVCRPCAEDAQDRGCLILEEPA